MDTKASSEVPITTHESQLNKAPCAVIRLVHLGCAELLAQDKSDGLLVAWDQSVVWADVAGVVAGVGVWRYAEWNATADIYLGYVLPEYRRRGVYRAIYQAMKESAQRKGARSLTGYVDVKNADMQACARALGRDAIAIAFREEFAPSAGGDTK